MSNIEIEPTRIIARQQQQLADGMLEAARMGALVDQLLEENAALRTALANVGAAEPSAG